MCIKVNLTPPPPSFLQAPFNQSAHLSSLLPRSKESKTPFFFKAVLQRLFRYGKTRSAEKPFVSRVPSVRTARDSSNGASAEGGGGGGGIPPHTHTTTMQPETPPPCLCVVYVFPPTYTSVRRRTQCPPQKVSQIFRTEKYVNSKFSSEI